MALFPLLGFAAMVEKPVAPSPGPRLSGGVEQTALPTEMRVCPGSPVVLTVCLDPASSMAGRSELVVRYEIVEGNGWFGSLKEMRAAPLGAFGILWNRFLGSFRARSALSPLRPDSASTAVVFHPLGKEGEKVLIRATSEGAAEDLGAVDFRFQVGTAHSRLLSEVAAKGLANEMRIEKLLFEVEETIDVRTDRGSGVLTGNPYRVQRTFLQDLIITKPLSEVAIDQNTKERHPFDVKDSLYIKCQYWGETPTEFIGCLLDPDPPNADAYLMLYTFDKETGLMKGLRFYNATSCGWASFLWNPDVGDGLPYTIQIQRRVYEPPTRLKETVSVFRENFRRISVAPGPTPTLYDPSRDEDSERPYNPEEGQAP